MVECLIKDTTMTDIADAIRSKNSATTTYLPSEMPAAIQAISTLLEETADATATADDIAKGKTAYIGEKEPVTGNIPVYSGITMTYDSLTENTDSTVTVKGTRTSKVILTADGYASTKVPFTEFGDAANTDVALGTTFTSEAGLKVNGSLKEGLDDNSGSYYITYNIVDGEKTQYSLSSIKPANKIIYKTATIKNSSTITLSDPLSETESTFGEQKNNYQEYPYFYGDYGDGTTDSTVYKYTELRNTSITGGGTRYYYTYYKQHVNPSTIKLTATAIEDSIIRKDSSYAIESPIGDLPIANGKYCWKKYRVQKNWEKTTENLGTSKPTEASYTKYTSYTITDDGYYQLSGTGGYFSGYYLPSGATNGATKTIYFYAWSALDSSYYYKWTLGDTYTETLGNFLGYVGSNDSEAYPLGIRDKYWYIPVATLEVTDETLKWGTFRIGEYPLPEGTISSGTQKTYTFDTGLSTITSMTIMKYDVSESPITTDFYWFYGDNINCSISTSSDGTASLQSNQISFSDGACTIGSGSNADAKISDGTYVWFARGS